VGQRPFSTSPSNSAPEGKRKKEDSGPAKEAEGPKETLSSSIKRREVKGGKHAYGEEGGTLKYSHIRKIMLIFCKKANTA